MKTGIVDVGGGMRDIYGAGILDHCLEQGICFDYCIGVSAGSANLCSYLAGQKGRNYKFYTEYAFRKEYMSVWNWFKTRNFINLDYAYGTLTNSDGEYPLDYDRIMTNPAHYDVVATDALTGKPCYFNFAEVKKDDYGIVKASSCVPAVNKAYMIDRHPYFDGGISDPIPFEKCFENGCEKVVVILTRPKSSRRDPDNDKTAVRFLRRKYPNTAIAMSLRAQTYNQELEQAIRLEQEGKVLILAPDDISGMKTLTKDREIMDGLYRKGIQDAGQIRAFLS